MPPEEKERRMPQIIVTAGDAANLDGAVTLRERINTSDFESARFTANLVERLGWAVSDAAEVEEHGSAWASDSPEVHETHDASKPRELVEA
jgi:hypothetical protein